MDIIAKIKSMLENGFASSEEKAELKKQVEAQEKAVQELVAKEYNEVLALPEEDIEGEIKKSVKSIFKSNKKEIAEDIKAEIVDKVQKILDEHKEKMAKKVGVYSKAAKKNVVRKAANNFIKEQLKSIFDGKETDGFVKLEKEMTTDDSASPYAGLVTGEYLSAEIRHLQTEYGVAAREFETVTFTESSYKANNLATDVSVGWVDEAGSISSTQAVIGQKTLEIKKLAAIITLTRELLQEQEIDIISFLGSRVAEGFTKAEDEAFFIGDGTSTYGGFTGLLNDTGVNSVAMTTGNDSFEDLQAEDLIKLIDAVPSAVLKNGKFYMDRTILSIVRTLRADAVTAGDGKGGFIYQMPAESRQGTIWGYPVIEVEAMPGRADTAADTPFILFGDLKKATIRGIRGGITTDKFDAGTVRNVADNADVNLITTDRQAIRWISQVGYISIIPTAVAALKTAA